MQHLKARKKKDAFRNAVLGALMISSLSFSPGLCQSDEPQSPTSVSEKSFAALKSGKANDYAKLMLPSELERFRKTMLLVADMAQAKGQEKKVLAIFQVPDRQSLDKLSPEDFLGRIMQKQMTPDVLEIYSKANFKVLGQVTEGEDVVHCVYSLTIPDFGTKTNVVSLKKDGPNWGMLLTSDLDKLMQMLKLQFANQPAGTLQFTPELKGVKLLGSIISGDTAYLVFRSTTSINGAPLEKVGQIEVQKTEPEYKLITANDKAGLEKMLQKKLGMFTNLAKTLSNISGATSQGSQTKPKTVGRKQPKRAH